MQKAVESPNSILPVMLPAEPRRAERLHAAFYIALAAASVALLWLLPFFPSEDGTTHVYNLVILRGLLQGTGGWSRFYSPDLHLTPNLGFALFFYPLLGWFSPFVAERIFLTFYLLLMTASAPIFLCALGRPALPLSYFVFVALFGDIVVMGFYSDAIGVPFLLLGIALGWKIRHRPWPARFLALNAAGAFLFVVHLIPFVVFLLALGLLAAAEGRGVKQGIGRGAKFALLMIPSLALVAYELSRHAAKPEIVWSLVYPRLVRDLLSFSAMSYSGWQRLPGFVAALLVIPAAIEGWRRASTEAERILVRRFLGAVCGLLVLMQFAAPNGFFGGSFFKWRLPVFILLLGLPILESRTKRICPSRFAALAALVAACALAVSAAGLWREARVVAEFTRGFQANLPCGTKILVARFDIQVLHQPDPLLHAGSYYGVRGAVDLGNYEPVAPYFPVRARNPIPWLEAFAVYLRPRAADWSKFPGLDYLLCWKAQPEDAQRLERGFTLFWSEPGHPLSIWKKRAR